MKKIIVGITLPMFLMVSQALAVEKCELSKLESKLEEFKRTYSGESKASDCLGMFDRDEAYDCMFGCSGSCDGCDGCSSGCRGCDGGCQGTCDTGCKGGCMESCKNGLTICPR